MPPATTDPPATPGVRLRPVEPMDLPLIFEAQRDPESVALSVVPPRDRASFDEHWARTLADDSVIARVIDADGELAGWLLCFPRLGVSEVGYWILRERWGRGIAGRALGAFLRAHPARPLYARVAVHNPASMRVLERAGFRPDPDGPRLDDGVEEVVFRIDHPVCEFAFPGELRDRLVAAVLSGRKTSTSSLLLEYELDAAPLPEPGERSVVVDSDDRAVGIIEVTEVQVRGFAEVDDGFAREEGEGFAGHADWADGHRRFWESAEYRAAVGRPDFSVRDDTPVVMERFRLVETLDPARDRP